MICPSWPQDSVIYTEEKGKLNARMSQLES